VPVEPRHPRRHPSSCTKAGWGKILVSRGLCYKRRDSIGKANGEQPIPAGIDYDLWCGPAPKAPLHGLKHALRTGLVSGHGNGDIGNQGIPPDGS